MMSVVALRCIMVSVTDTEMYHDVSGGPEMYHSISGGPEMYHGISGGH